eukprot:1150553-Pelagomonas_calceolata.AAC.6
MADGRSIESPCAMLVVQQISLLRAVLLIGAGEVYPTLSTLLHRQFDVEEHESRARQRLHRKFQSLATRIQCAIAYPGCGRSAALKEQQIYQGKGATALSPHKQTCMLRSGHTPKFNTEKTPIPVVEGASFQSGHDRAKMSGPQSYTKKG